MAKEKPNTETPRNTSPGIRLIRVIDRTIHISSTDRQREVDYTIQNDTDDSTFNFVLLPLRKFERNLKVYDEDGTRLNYYPNSFVKESLGNGRSNSELADNVEAILDNFQYQIYIQLQPDKTLDPGELRTIQLTFEQSEPVDYYRIWEPSLFSGWLSVWERKFFRIPSFIADVKRFPEMSNDLFIVVVGAPGYSATGDGEVSGTEPSGTIYENGLDDNTRVVSTRLPAPDNDEYDYKMSYRLIPANDSMMWSLAFFWGAATILGIGSVGAYVLDNISSVPEAVSLGISTATASDIGQLLSGGIITVILGLVFALNADWTDRYRILSIVPLLIHSIAWLLWRL